MASSLNRRLAAAELAAQPRRIPPTPAEKQYLQRAAEILAEKPDMSFKDAYLAAVREDI